MHGVERLGLRGAQAHQADSADLKSGGLEVGEDFAGVTGLDGVGFDDR